MTARSRNDGSKPNRWEVVVGRRAWATRLGAVVGSAILVAGAIAVIGSFLRVQSATGAVAVTAYDILKVDVETADTGSGGLPAATMWVTGAPVQVNGHATVFVEDPGRLPDQREPGPRTVSAEGGLVAASLLWEDAQAQLQVRRGAALTLGGDSNAVEVTVQNAGSVPELVNPSVLLTDIAVYGASGQLQPFIIDDHPSGTLAEVLWADGLSFPWPLDFADGRPHPQAATITDGAGQVFAAVPDPPGLAGMQFGSDVTIIIAPAGQAPASGYVMVDNERWPLDTARQLRLVTGDAGGWPAATLATNPSGLSLTGEFTHITRDQEDLRPTRGPLDLTRLDAWMALLATAALALVVERLLLRAKLPARE